MQNQERSHGSASQDCGIADFNYGGSQGIGRGTGAWPPRTAGAKVLAAARSATLLEELSREVRPAGGALETVQADVTSADDRRRMVEAALKHFGGLDVLVNNAGIGATGHFAEASPKHCATSWRSTSSA